MSSGRTPPPLRFLPPNALGGGSCTPPPKLGTGVHPPLADKTPGRNLFVAGSPVGPKNKSTATPCKFEDTPRAGLFSSPAAHTPQNQTRVKPKEPSRRSNTAIRQIGVSIERRLASPPQTLGGKISQAMSGHNLPNITTMVQTYFLLKKHYTICPTERAGIVEKIQQKITKNQGYLNSRCGLNYKIILESILLLVIDTTEQKARIQHLYDHIVDLLTNCTTEKDFKQILELMFPANTIGINPLLHFLLIQLYQKAAATTWNDFKKQSQEIKESFKQYSALRLTIELSDTRACYLTGTVLKLHLKPLLPLGMKTGPNINKEFKAGGVGKQFNPRGLLRTKDRSVAQEFTREQAVSNYILGLENEALRSQLTLHLSFQKALTPTEVSALELSPNGYYYAKVTMYDNPPVTSIELDALLSGASKIPLSKQQIAEIARQTISILGSLYLAHIEHNDSHGHNILVHICAEKVLVKFIDFGKASFDPTGKSKRNDLNYMFFREATNPLETFKRNHFRDQAGTAQVKHYPLHKLAQYLGIGIIMVNKILFQFGVELQQQLDAASGNPEKISAIFDECAKNFQQWLLLSSKEQLQA